MAYVSTKDQVRSEQTATLLPSKAFRRLGREIQEFGAVICSFHRSSAANRRLGGTQKGVDCTVNHKIARHPRAGIRI